MCIWIWGDQHYIYIQLKYMCIWIWGDQHYMYIQLKYVYMDMGRSTLYIHTA